MLYSFNIIALGDTNTGKTSWIQRHLTGEFTKQHIPTLNKDNFIISFYTNLGKVIFNIRDTPGMEIVKSRTNYRDYDAAIIFFDVSNEFSFKNVDFYIQNFRDENPNAPIVIVGNKVDLKNRKISVKKYHLFKKYSKLYCWDVSTKSNYNLYMPFLSILISLIKSDIKFVSSEEWQLIEHDLEKKLMENTIERILNNFTECKRIISKL